MTEEEVRTYSVAQEATVNDITVTIPWVQRQANGAVIARLHVTSSRHAAGEVLLTEQDLTALDPEERPLRTQVRRFWGYGAISDVTPAHLQTARFDVGFRADIGATHGQCGLSIAIIRTFRAGEGPRAVGGPWLFRFRIADDEEIAAALRAETERQEAIQRENAQREAARLERIRLENERLEAARQQRMAALRRAEAPEPVIPEPSAPATSELREAVPAAEERPLPARGRRPGRFTRPELPPREPSAEPVAGLPPAETTPAYEAVREREDATREVATEAIPGPAATAEATDESEAGPYTPALEPTAASEAESVEGAVELDSAAPARVGRPRGRPRGRRPARADANGGEEQAGASPGDGVPEA